MSTTVAPSTPAKQLRNAVIRLAGNSQDGIQSIGGILARLAGRTAQEVMTYMTIPSTISGGPSIFQVHLGSGEVLSAGDEADVLVAFYQHSYDGHLSSVRNSGICIYDSGEVTELKHERGITHIGVPFTSATIEATGGSARDRGKNIFVLGLLCAAFNLDKEKIIAILSRQFGKKDESVLRNAMLAFDAGFAYQVGDLEKFAFAPGEAGSGHRISSDGNTMLTMGLLAAGVRYGSAYPITPWSSIMEMMRSELPKYGGIYVQAEDELSAIAMTIGAAFAGHLAMTGSSGPGLSLKMEALGYACMAELPLIVVNVQRGGPSTGLPTSMEQSDLLQAIYGSHGDSPRIVLAPENVEDCFYIALEAGRLAREYSCPVIILSDQAISSRIEAFAEPDLDKHWVEPMCDTTPRAEDFKPYPLDQITRHAPPGTKMLGGKYPIVTGLEHDEFGHPSGSPKMHTAMTNKRRDKLVKLSKELPLPPVHGDAEGDVLVVGWGSTYGAIAQAVMGARRSGLKVSHIHIRYMNPMPRNLGELLRGFKKISVPEMNNGMLVKVLRAEYLVDAQGFNKISGQPFKIAELEAEIHRMLGVQAPQ
jgi:2-oxoglutarate ferredoxin oxidoreductase subunit alpha